MIPAAITLGLLLAACGRQGMEHMTGPARQKRRKRGDWGATDGTEAKNRMERRVRAQNDGTEAKTVERRDRYAD